MVSIKKEYLKMLHQAAWINRVMLAIVYIWFGYLKVIGTSPAEGLVAELFQITLSGTISVNLFIKILGLFECVLGFVWLVPNFSKIAFYLLVFHLLTTFLPIILLPAITWTTFMSLSLVGQYIIKNVVIFSSAYFIYRFSLVG